MAHFQYAHETDLLLEIETLKRKLALYENTFRGEEVRVGDYWCPGRTKEKFMYDCAGIVTAIEVDESGQKVLHLYTDMGPALLSEDNMPVQELQ